MMASIGEGFDLDMHFKIGDYGNLREHEFQPPKPGNCQGPIVLAVWRPIGS